MKILKVDKIEKMKYKSNTLNGSQLALVSMGFMRNLFPKPKGRDLLVENHRNETTTMYFSVSYYDSLLESMENHRLEGAFARSNSESDWNSLHDKLKESSDVDKDLTSLRPHFMSE